MACPAAHLRLAVLARARGDVKATATHLDAALASARSIIGGATAGPLAVANARSAAVNALLLRGQLAELFETSTSAEGGLVASLDAHAIAAAAGTAVETGAAPLPPVTVAAIVTGTTPAARVSAWLGVKIGTSKEWYGLASAESAASGSAEPDAYVALAVANAVFRDVAYYATAAAAATAAMESKTPLAAGHMSLADAESGREASLRKAFDGYKDVLKRNPHNIYAGNGLGMVLAEQGRLEAAAAVFKTVREAAGAAAAVSAATGAADYAAAVVPVTHNLAHTLTAQGHHAQALQLYNQTVKRTLELGAASAAGGAASAAGTAAAAGADSAAASSADTAVSLLVSAARGHVEANELKAAIPLLQRAILLHPHDLRLRYNHAFAQAQEGLRFLTVAATGKHHTPDEVEEAVQLMRAARETFVWCKSVTDK